VKRRGRIRFLPSSEEESQFNKLYNPGYMIMEAKSFEILEFPFRNHENEFKLLIDNWFANQQITKK
jgi:hypothetical protein